MSKLEQITYTDNLGNEFIERGEVANVL